MIRSNPIPGSTILPPGQAFAPDEGGVKIALSSTENTILGFTQLDHLTNNKAKKGLLKIGEIEIEVTRMPSGSRFLPFGGYHVTTPVASVYVPFPDITSKPKASRRAAQDLAAK